MDTRLRGYDIYLYLSDVNCLIVIPAQAVIQKMEKSDFLRNCHLWFSEIQTWFIVFPLYQPFINLI
jgi:hypothetical protein